MKWLTRGVLVPFTVATGCGLVMLVFFGMLLFGLLIIKLWWSWAIPDLFPGAVQQGLIAASISWWTSFKLALALALISALASSRRNKA